MMLKFSAIAFAVATVFASFCVTALADESGMASIHDWRLEGRKTCLVGHFHTGTTDGIKRTKKAAMRSAIKSWQEFTAGEYGLDWAYFRNAASKSAKCERSSAGYSCYIEGRACNPKRRRR